MSRAGSKVSPIYLLCIEKNRKLPLDCIRTELRSFSFSSVIKFFNRFCIAHHLFLLPTMFIPLTLPKNDDLKFAYYSILSKTRFF